MGGCGVIAHGQRIPPVVQSDLEILGRLCHALLRKLAQQNRRGSGRHGQRHGKAGQAPTHRRARAAGHGQRHHHGSGQQCREAVARVGDHQRIAGQHQQHQHRRPGGVVAKLEQDRQPHCRTDGKKTLDGRAAGVHRRERPGDAVIVLEIEQAHECSALPEHHGQREPQARHEPEGKALVLVGMAARQAPKDQHECGRPECAFDDAQRVEGAGIAVEAVGVKCLPRQQANHGADGQAGTEQAPGHDPGGCHDVSHSRCAMPGDDQGHRQQQVEFVPEEAAGPRRPVEHRHGGRHDKQDQSRPAPNQRCGSDQQRGSDSGRRRQMPGDSASKPQDRQCQGPMSPHRQARLIG